MTMQEVTRNCVTLQSRHSCRGDLRCLNICSTELSAAGYLGHQFTSWPISQLTVSSIGSPSETDKGEENVLGLHP